MNYTKTQTIVLTFLRLMLGYHFLFEGIDKLFSQSWTASPFLIKANWLFSGLFQSLAENPTLLDIVDILNVWGQILIGIGLLIGLYSKSAAYFGALLLLIYYVAIPPFIEGILFIDKNLIEMFAFIIVTIFPTSQLFGIDYLMNKFWRNKNV